MLPTKAKLVLAAIAIAIVAIVCFQNTEVVHTRLLFTTITMPRIVLLLVTFAAGLVLGGIVTSLVIGKSAEER